VDPARRLGLPRRLRGLVAKLLRGRRLGACEVLEQRAAALLPGLFLARVDGKSPVEYLTSEVDRERVRRIGRGLVADPVSRLSSVAAAWRAELAS
jgi:hypothetical protein